MAEEKRKRILSGIQPTGTPTLGNYIGAVRNWALLQSDYECLYMVADLHSLTVRQVPAELRRRTRELAALLLAVVLLKVFLVPGLPCGHTLFAAGTGAFLLCTGLELPQTLFEAARGMLVLPDLLTGIGIGLFGLCGLVCAWQACGEETE